MEPIPIPYDDKEYKERVIIIKSCNKCIQRDDCKEWNKLPPKTRFSLVCGVGLKDFILDSCPLTKHEKNNA